MKRSSAAVASAVAIMALLALVPVFASIVVTTKTGTFSTNFTGTMALPDIGSTTTFVVPYSTTFTYQSTSTVSTTASSSEAEMASHVLGVSSGCPSLTVPTAVTRIDDTFKANDSNGADAWQLQFVESDPSTNSTAIVFFTSHNGVHTLGEYFYQGSSLVLNETVPVTVANGGTPIPGQPLIGDVQKGQFVDFYADDGGQVFWYTIGAINGELFTYNLQNYPEGFHAASDFLRIVPLANATSVSFSGLRSDGIIADTQLGQQSNTNDIPSTSVLTPGGLDPCANPIEMSPVTSTNVCAALTGLQANSIGITESWSTKS